MAVLKTLVVTCTTSPQSLGSHVVPVGCKIAIDSGTVYMGDSSLNGSTNGFKLSTTPMAIGEYVGENVSEMLDLSQLYVQGGSGNEIVRLFFIHHQSLT